MHKGHTKMSSSFLSMAFPQDGIATSPAANVYELYRNAAASSVQGRVNMRRATLTQSKSSSPTWGLSTSRRRVWHDGSTRALTSTYQSSDSANNRHFTASFSVMSTGR